jgi:RND superfamily putative drug exporter
LQAPADDADRSPRRSGVTVATAGRAVFFSGLTVLLGLLGLVLFEFMILRSVGVAGRVVVGFAVSAALTLLPALLTLFGHRIDGSRSARSGAAGREGPGRGSPAGSCDGRWPS